MTDWLVDLIVNLLGAHPAWAVWILWVPLFIAASALELLHSLTSGRKLHRASDTLANLGVYLGYLAIESLWIPVAYAIYSCVHEFAPLRIGSDWWLFQGSTSPWAWISLFVLEDLCFYLFHRASHRSPLLWASHLTHHSSRELNLSVALRQSWTPFLGLLFWLPLPLIGFDPSMVLLVQGLSLAYQSLLHTQAIRSLGPLEWVFNTPSHHRAHHGSHPPYIDRNFGGVLIVWDRLFGTFQREMGPVRFGVDGHAPTFNPFRIVGEGWAAYFSRGAKETR